jgi:hypothetical protein
MLISGLKFETGVDWYAYTNWCDKIPSLEYYGSMHWNKEVISTLDIGFNLLISIIKLFGGHIQTLFFVVSLFTFSLLFRSLKEYTKYCLSSLLLYYCIIYFFLDMSGIRQAISLNIFFFSIRFIKKGKFLNYLFLSIIAFFFHWTSIIFILIYFFVRRRYTNFFAIMFMITCIVILLFHITWAEFFFKQLSKSFPETNIITKVIVYTNKTSVYAGESAFGLGTLLNFIIFSIFTWKRLIFEKKMPYFNIFYNLFLIYLFLYFALFEFGEISGRLRLYTFLSLIVLLPNCLLIVTNNSKLFLSFIFALYGFIYGRIFISSDEVSIAYQPYQNYIIYKIMDKQSTGKERAILIQIKYDRYFTSYL